VTYPKALPISQTASMTSHPKMSQRRALPTQASCQYRQTDIRSGCHRIIGSLLYDGHGSFARRRLSGTPNTGRIVFRGWTPLVVLATIVRPALAVPMPIPCHRKIPPDVIDDAECKSRSTPTSNPLLGSPLHSWGHIRLCGVLHLRFLLGGSHSTIDPAFR
jgi:hypothetical protein